MLTHGMHLAGAKLNRVKMKDGPSALIELKEKHFFNIILMAWKDKPEKLNHITEFVHHLVPPSIARQSIHIDPESH